MIKSTLVMSAVFATALAGAAAADFTDRSPDYVDLVPLDQLVSAGVQSCGAQSTLQLPMIDWSGDFVTVHANGGTSTDPDSWMGLYELDANLYVENDLVKQAEAYLSCDTPFMRVTQGQAQMLAPLTEVNDETQMVALYQHSFSLGDHLVTRGIDDVSDLCTADIAIMRYGPHVDFMGRILSDAGCDIGAMQSAGKIHWMENLSGQNSPYHALVSDSDIDAAFVVTPDMLAMTGGDVPNSKALVSTRTLSRAVSDVYVVRRDFFLANEDRLRDMVHAFLLAGEEFQGTMGGLGQILASDTPQLTVDQQTILGMMADTFDAVPDAIEAGWFWLDADYSGYPGNVSWAIETNARGWLGLNNEVQVALAALGLSDRPYTLAHAAWDYTSFEEGLENTSVAEQPTFNASAVAAFVSTQQKTGTLASGELYKFEIFFQPDQNTFPVAQYGEDFSQLLDFAQAYGGAVITVEGHADPLGYLIAQNPARFNQAGEPASRLMLKRQATSLRNLSATRATAARDGLIGFASDNGASFDPSQFTIVAHGINDPRSGMCGDLPCAPATETEWRANMRVVFRIIAVPAESNVFIAAQ